ncbi:DCN1-like protein [Eumeta japonica]|uniref:Defective in cullin neddylation protein n=1 Tax=Eumeta variegata TaxID=151549 RepID=A0A4C1SLB5_EUMVA|nr:DCN1-like protein [Eumeta japonica]
MGVHLDLITSDVLDHYRTYSLIERLMHAPTKLLEQCCFQLGPRDQGLNHRKCSKRNTGEKLSSRYRKDLDEVAENRCKIKSLQNKLKSTQRDKVKKFISLTQTGEQTAIYCLQQNDWKLDLASDNYFQNPEYYYRELDRKRIEQLFLRYRDPSDAQKITSEEVQCEFTREEFVNGMTDLGIDSIDKLKAKLPQLEMELNDLAKFKDFYHFTFNYAKDPGQKALI